MSKRTELFRQHDAKLRRDARLSREERDQKATLTNVKVWKMLRDNRYSSIIQGLTYDMRIWAKSIAIKLIYEFKKTKIKLEKRFFSILVSCNSTDRKEIALKISKEPAKCALFAMLDHEHSDVDKFTWDIVKPVNEIRYEKIEVEDNEK